MNSLGLLVVLSLIGVTLCDLTSPQIECKGGEYSCYNCLGRDYDNCIHGQTCCDTACFKMVDDDHELIAKGCWSPLTDEIKQVPTDNHARSYKTSVPLPWAQDEVIGGMGYFCRGDKCNPAARAAVSVLGLVAALLLAAVLH